MNPPPTGEPTGLVDELRQLHRELIEQEYVRRCDGRERVLEAVSRLGEQGSAAAILTQAAGELGESCEFDLVLLTRIADRRLRPVSLFSSAGDADSQALLAALNSRPIPLGYPMIEEEVAKHQETVLVDATARRSRAAPALAEVIGWSSYVVAPIVLDGASAGLLHASRAAGRRAADATDAELAGLFCAGLGQTFERSMLRAQLARQALQLESAARWIEARAAELSAGRQPTATSAERPDLSELLTPRELDVLRLIAQGRSNRVIATTLVLGEGTVKYHVKNILRKLEVRSRTEAISRYVALQDARP